VETYDSVSNLLTRDHTWDSPQGTVVTGPTGAVGYTVKTVLGVPRSIGQSQPAGAGCAASSTAVTYDASGNVDSADDFNGSRVCYVADTSRNLVVTRVEGLTSTQVCSAVTPTNSALPAGARKITTTWHPQGRLETKRAEPGKLSTYVYNGQPDPFNGNAAANCAPGTALLPDGRPIAVLCKKVEQASNDADGRKAFDLEGTPAVAGDADFAKVSLLLHMDGLAGSTSAVDSAPMPKTITASGNIQLSSTGSKFGGSSSLFDGAGDYWSAPHSSEFSIQSGDFTVEAWVYRASSGQQHYLLSKRSNTQADGWEWRITAANALQFFHTAGTQISSTIAVPTGAWVHLAATRNGTTVRLFIGGALAGSATFSNGVENTADTLKIGVGNDLSGGFDGYIDEVRITKGLARYAAAFTPPTTSFANSTTGAPAVPSLLDASVPNRVWSYTYNDRGQVLTAKGPRTDVNDTTTYAYYTDTTADHTLGDLKTVTDARNRVTQFTLYNKQGQVLRSIDANNVITDYSYDARQRLKSASVGGQTTNYDYFPTGQLKRVTQPDTNYVEYGYDAAHRLVAVSDNLNNRIDYTLDNAGHRTAEKASDPSGALSRQMSRVMDALGRVQQTTGGQ
jgi:YD repeat-containing protein